MSLPVVILIVILGLLAPIWFPFILLYEIVHRLGEGKKWHEPFLRAVFLVVVYVAVYGRFDFWGLVIAMYIGSGILYCVSRRGDYVLLDEQGEGFPEGEEELVQNAYIKRWISNFVYMLIGALVFYPVCFIPHLIDGWEEHSWTVWARVAIWGVLSILVGMVLQYMGFTSLLGGTLLWAFLSADLFLIISPYTGRFFPARPRMVYQNRTVRVIQG